MLKNLNRSRWLILAVLGSFLVSISAFAQVPPTQGVTQRQLGNATAKLSQIETLFAKVENTKVATFRDSEEVEQAALAYAEAMKAGLDDALKNAETLAKTQGKKGSITPLDTFEKAEKANQPRLQKIEARANALDNQIKAGNIKVDRTIIQKLTVPERRELLDSLQPAVRETYIREQPALFKPVLNAPRKNLKSLNEENTQNKVAKVSDMVPNVNNMLIPSTYAAAGVPCIRLAISKQWTKLAACVANAGSQAKSIYNQFRSCWNNTRRPLRWLKRARCVARLIARLA
ncbi:hypothetical protein [Calothrix sp. UHCC 0171]|uniref:hypothetical protein n=1 Tax=Calothrix sp. UHCC 0171 TaxID=3110245 RepID=UPI002B21A03F|nr:hypothetical protein [Calothrix sp. UHCC 0171]MEA5573082.1 hypothetical protein [Calothrix sp. UHCC 0171]